MQGLGPLHPQRDHVEIRAPVFVVGMPRTGTTLLHNLLARVEGIWAPPLWDLFKVPEGVRTLVRLPGSEPVWYASGGAISITSEIG